MGVNGYILQSAEYKQVGVSHFGLCQQRPIKQKLTGHIDIRTTLRYTHVSNRQKLQAKWGLGYTGGGRNLCFGRLCMAGRESRRDKQRSAFGYVVRHLYFYGPNVWPGGTSYECRRHRQALFVARNPNENLINTL